MRRRARRWLQGSTATQGDEYQGVTERAITCVVIVGSNKRLLIGNGEEDLTHSSVFGCDDGPLPRGEQESEVVWRRLQLQHNCEKPTIT